MHEHTKILLVDDDRRILEIFSRSLQDLDYYVKTASSQDEMLHRLSKETFDIVFLDQCLGQTKGLNIIRRVRDRDPELYFVIITGNGSIELAVESLKTGAADFISKPFFVTDLIKSIDYVKRKKELAREKKELISKLEFKLDKKTEELRKVYLSVLASLAQAMEKKDAGTYGHSRRVGYYSRLIATVLDLDEYEKNSINAAALLHDIGKIGISDFILGKQGPLDKEEIDIIKSHPREGVEILKPLEQFEPILPAILHHHEHFDGSGYPGGLSGEDIPLSARIIAVADTYDAILSHRPYRSASAHDSAIKELLKHAGTQFDAAIVGAFIESIARYHHLYEPS